MFAGGSGKPREFNHLPNNRFDSHSGDEDRVFARNLCGCGQQARLEGASYTAALFAEAASAATVCQPATASPYSICCLLGEHLKSRLQCAALLWQSDERARGDRHEDRIYILRRVQPAVRSGGGHRNPDL
jgi:hypothetical protein